MDNYINRVMAAIYDTGIVANQFGFTGDFLFVDVSLRPEQEPEALLLDFDEEEKNLNIIARFGEWFPTDVPHVSALMYIALETANGAIHDAHAPGRVLLNLSEEDGARFMYSACIPLLLLPQEMAAFVKRVAEGVMAARDFLSRFATRAQEGIIAIDDALELEPLEEGQMRVTIHPVLAVLGDTDINMGDALAIPTESIEELEGKVVDGCLEAKDAFLLPVGEKENAMEITVHPAVQLLKLTTKQRDAFLSFLSNNGITFEAFLQTKKLDVFPVVTTDECEICMSNGSNCWQIEKLPIAKNIRRVELETLLSGSYEIYRSACIFLGISSYKSRYDFVSEVNLSLY